MCPEGVDARVSVSEYLLLYASQRRLELALTCIGRQVNYAVELLYVYLDYPFKLLGAELLAYPLLDLVIRTRHLSCNIMINLMLSYLLSADAHIVSLDDNIPVRHPYAAHTMCAAARRPHLNAAEDIPHLSACNAPDPFGGADEFIIPICFREYAHISRICTLGNTELG